MSFSQPPVPIGPEDQEYDPETVDPDRSPDLPPIGDASALRNGDAGPGEDADAEAEVAAATDDVPPGTEDAETTGTDTPMMDAALDERADGADDSSDAGTDARTDPAVAGEESAAEADVDPSFDASQSTHGAASGVDTTDPDAAGAEVGMTQGESSYFEPEEDPEGHRDS